MKSHKEERTSESRDDGARLSGDVEVNFAVRLPVIMLLALEISTNGAFGREVTRWIRYIDGIVRRRG